MGRPCVILIDTHVWIWLNTEPERLSLDALGRLRVETQILLSAISVYETMVAIEKGRIETPLEPESLVRRWLGAGDIKRVPVGEEVAMLARLRGFVHGDPFDRIIAATACHLQVPLMTADRNLLDLEWLDTVPA